MSILSIENLITRKRLFQNESIQISTLSYIMHDPEYYKLL